MDPCYPTEAWSNIPAFQHVSEELEFWNTHMLVDCGDDVCAEPLEDDDDERMELNALRDVAQAPDPTMSLAASTSLSSVTWAATPLIRSG
jgi:hypothetical protein